jgi:hypothetical protein
MATGPVAALWVSKLIIAPLNPEYDAAAARPAKQRGV